MILAAGDHRPADGDAVARGLLPTRARCSGETAVHMVRDLRMEHTAFDLVFARDLFDGGSRDLLDAVEAACTRSRRRRGIKRLEIPPVIGAALMALDLAGDTAAKDARETLVRRARAGVRDQARNRRNAVRRL